MADTGQPQLQAQPKLETQPQTQAPPDTRSRWLAFAIAAAVVLADQLSKAWILGPFALEEKGSVRVSPIFSLTMVQNRGVSFGALQTHGIGRWILIAFAGAVVVFLFAWAWRAQRALTASALGLIAGGALGNNLIDRIRLGWVVDFLDFSGIGFIWVFNVADAAINIGVALLLLDMFLPQRRPAAGGTS